MNVLRLAALALLAVWIGGLLTLGAIGAPTLFAVLESHDPAGGRTLAATAFGAIFLRFEHLSVIVGALLIATLAARAMLGPRPRRLAARIWTVAGMLALSLGTTFWIIPRIDRIRNSTPGSVTSLTNDDPRRVEFDRLHGLSNGLALVTLIAGLGLLWYEVNDTH
jgi:hypothetical protein